MCAHCGFRALLVGSVNDVPVQLAAVTVDASLHVHLVGGPSAARDRLDREFAAASQQRAATAGRSRQAPPEQPGERLVRTVVALDDALGTGYTLVAAPPVAVARSGTPP